MIIALATLATSLSVFATEITHYNVELSMRSSANKKTVDKSQYKISRQMLSETEYEERVIMPGVSEPLKKKIVKASGENKFWSEDISLGGKTILSSTIEVQEKKGSQWFKWNVVRKPFACGEEKAQCKEAIIFETQPNGTIVGRGKRISTDAAIKEFKTFKIVMTPQ